MVKEKLRQALLASQKNFCSEEEIKSWFDPLCIEQKEQPPTIQVTFPHSFFEYWFTNSFQQLFENICYDIFGYTFTFIYGKTPNFNFPYQPKLPPINNTSQHTIYTEKQHLESFIVNGKYNWILSIIQNMLQPFSKKLSKKNIEQSPQLFVLFGQQATGKTHLMKATDYELSKIPLLLFNYTSIDSLASLLTKEPIFLFRENLQKYQFILIDDFQRTTTYKELQAELCILFDYCKDNKIPLMISGTGHPLSWQLPNDLYSRLEIGLWAELPQPDLDIRLRYAHQLAKEKKYSLSKEQLLIIAQHCHNMRCISGMLQRIMTHCSLFNRDLSEKELLTIIKQKGDTITISPQLIIMLVGESYGFSPNEIISEGRQQNLVLARQVAMYLCRELLGYSYPVIGRFFGGKDHTTVIHSVKKIKLLQDNNRVMHTMVKELIQKCQQANI